MEKNSYWKDTKEFFKRANPGALLFIIALVLVLLGALIPALGFIYKAGWFIIGFFVLLWVLWIVFRLKGI